MDQVSPDIFASLHGFWAEVLKVLNSLLLPTNLAQVALLFVLLVATWWLSRIAYRRMNDWMRGLEGVPKWKMRMLVLIRNRLWGILFVLSAWMSVVLIQQLTTFPSRRYIVVIWATIATAWVMIGLISALIRNPFLRRLVTWGGWIYVTLHYLGFLEAATGFLDSLSVELGEFRISALGVLKAAVITGVLFAGARLITRETAKRIADNKDIAPSFGVLAVKMLQIILYGSAFFLGLKAVGFDLTGLAVLSGAIGVGLGFGLQKVVSNLVSGVIILLDKSVKPGDVISLGETFGWIESLGARYVSVVTRDGREYLIPNEDLITGQVVNWSHSNELVRVDLEFGTSYHDDPHKVRRVAVAAAKSVGRVLGSRDPVCHITGFGDNSVNYILRFWITDPREGLTNVRGGVFLALWDAFQAEGISIPFPQREVRVLSDQPAVGTAVAAS
ncbi:MAG: mechanosensitive ion channel [Tabrizicola sp.]|nr:mechanosensitive ion channel [Tabrizicola sp.]